MNHPRLVLVTIFAASLLTYGQAPTSGTQPDNTKTNKRDRQPSEATADQQKANSSDTDITKNIRQSVMADKSLSTYAHNVKIITQNGAVTLKGPVKSEDERKTIVAKAVAVVGNTDKISDQMSVKQ